MFKLDFPVTARVADSDCVSIYQFNPCDGLWEGCDEYGGVVNVALNDLHEFETMQEWLKAVAEVEVERMTLAGTSDSADAIVGAGKKCQMKLAGKPDLIS